MSNDITIPPEALEAAKEAWYANHHKGTDERMTITCLAMLRAWPEAIKGRSLFDGEPTLFLPLQQEKSE